MGLTKKKAAIVILLAMLIAASILFGNKVASSSRHHSERITYLKEKEENARDLIAGANATAFLISMIPEDTATPNANQIAAIGKDYLIVLSAITAERYMLTITGYLSFCWIIPIALAAIMIYILTAGRQWGQLGSKLLLFGIVLYLVVPLSIKVSGLVDETYQKTIQETLQASEELKEDFHYDEKAGTPETEAPETEAPEKAEEESWFDAVADTITGAGEAVGETIGDIADGAVEVFDGAVDLSQQVPDLPQKASELAGRYVDAFVIMLVTTCIIPILTLLGIIWATNLILSINFSFRKSG